MGGRLFLRVFIIWRGGVAAYDSLLRGKSGFQMVKIVRVELLRRDRRCWLKLRFGMDSVGGSDDLMMNDITPVMNRSLYKYKK